MHTSGLLLLLLLLLFAGADGSPPFSFSNVIGSGMVLQRSVAARVWGFGGGASTNTVSCTLTWNGNTSAGTARGSVKNDAAGSWSVDLPVQAGTATPFGIRCELATASGQPVPGANAISVSDVLFGEVFLCAGEGNMQMGVSALPGASLQIQQANNYPDIRLFSVGQSNYSLSPLAQLAAPPQLAWSRASSTSISDGSAFGYFSAVCWHFARTLYDSASWGHVPVGLVAATWSDSYLTAWAPAGALSSCPRAETDSGGANQPAVLYNALLHPFVNMPLRGVVWYQGESDLQHSSAPAAFYRCAQPAMLSSWRARWNLQGSAMAFYNVQLQPFTEGGPYGLKLAELRTAQPLTSSDPSCFASAIDLGDPSSPYGNAYPRLNKPLLAARLAYCALATSYGVAAVVTKGPQAVVAKLIDGQQILVQFSADSIAGGLNIIVNSACPQQADCAAFAVASANGASAPVTGVEIDASGFAVLLRSPLGTKTKTVSYAMADWPLAILYNANGLPATPFNLTLSS